MKPSAKIGTTLGVVGAMLVVASPAARAEPSWLNPINVAEGEYNANASADVAMDATGDTIVVWVQQTGTSSRIETAWRPAGGTFGAPSTLSTPGPLLSSPVVAVDPLGDATVAWVSGGTGSPLIEVAWDLADQAFTPATILPSYNYPASNPVVAMDSKGDATVAWTWDNGGFDEVAASSRVSEGNFGTPVRVSSFSDGSATSPAIAMDPEGDTTVVWTQNETNQEHNLIQMATQPAGSNFGPPTGFQAIATDPTVAMSANGDIIVAWEGYNAPSATDTLEATTRTFNSSSSEPITLASVAPSGKSFEAVPDVSMDSKGDATIVWASSEGVRIDRRPSGGPFEAPSEPLKNPLVTEDYPVVVMDPQGDRAVAWEQIGFEKGGNFLLASTGLVGGVLGTPIFVSRENQFLYAEDRRPPLTMAIDDRGDAASAWVSDQAGNETVEVAGYQAGGPSIEALQEPSSGQVGTDIEFSVSAVSVWSYVLSIKWSWGDGSPETSGLTARHRFDTPGTYQIIVSTTDALGNTTDLARTISIQPATPDPGTGQDPFPSKTTTPRVHVGILAASTFRPYFATRASIGSGSIGILEEVAEIKGARAGDTFVVRCITGCQRPLRKAIHVKIDKTPGKVVVAPPLHLYKFTRLAIELRAPRRLTRFVEYRFARARGNVLAHVTHEGCLTQSGRASICP